MGPSPTKGAFITVDDSSTTTLIHRNFTIHLTTCMQHRGQELDQAYLLFSRGGRGVVLFSRDDYTAAAGTLSQNGLSRSHFECLARFSS